jgi:hypothetical protein
LDYGGPTGGGKEVKGALLPVALTAALFAQQPLDSTDRLVRARELVIRRDQRLPNYTCLQTVDRHYFKLRRMDLQRSPCEQVDAHDPQNLILESTDRVRLDIKVSQGVEIGSWAGSSFSSRSIFDLVGGGPYGTGMLGGLMSDIFVNDGASYQYLGERTTGGARSYAYSFEVPLTHSHYRVKAGAGWVVTAFSGSFALDPDSLDLQRITARAYDLPPETSVCEVEDTVEYQKVRVGDGEFLLPRQSSMRLVMQDGTETQSAAVYSGCREYLGESIIHFDEAPVAGRAKGAEPAAAPLPEGLPFSVELTDPIDTDTAAAGDVVHAKIRKAVRAADSNMIVVPAGSAVQGRIVQMQHWVERPGQFKILMMVEKVEVGGVWRQLYARHVRDLTTSKVAGRKVIVVPPVGQASRVGVFRIATEKSRYRVPAGYVSNWVTVEPPAGE